MAGKGSDDDEVGYRRPPKHTRFKPGQSGNPKGRPPKRGPEAVDVAAILNEQIAVRQGGGTRQMTAFEISVRKLLAKALRDKNLSAAITFVKLCQKYGAIEPPEVPRQGGTVEAPRSWDFHEWTGMFLKHGPPPWPGPRSGLPGS